MANLIEDIKILAADRVRTTDPVLGEITGLRIMRNGKETVVFNHSNTRDYRETGDKPVELVQKSFLGRLKSLAENAFPSLHSLEDY
ncbi:MAG: hypothetical protein M1514_03260 [Patescibacteria group bacterium]|nr:hypothetical protein [Patescibacteria group bacterium]